MAPELLERVCLGQDSLNESSAALRLFFASITGQLWRTIIAREQKQIEALTAGLEKVSAQLEASKPAPQVVSNP